MYLNSQRQVVIEGDGTYPFVAVIDGEDLKVYGAQATWWNDRQTASGEDASVPGCRYVSLPMTVEPACHGSPYERFPWHTPITVYSHKNGHTLLAAGLADVGPAAPPKASGDIDLTPTLYMEAGGDPNDGSDSGHITVDYRIHGGTQYLSYETRIAAAKLIGLTADGVPAPYLHLDG